MTSIEIGVIKAMEEHGGAFEKALAAGFKHVDENRREFMKEKFIGTWMQYLQIALDTPTDENQE